jgi:hypothetical protein
MSVQTIHYPTHPHKNMDVLVLKIFAFVSESHQFYFIVFMQSYNGYGEELP